MSLRSAVPVPILSEWFTLEVYYMILEQSLPVDIIRWRRVSTTWDYMCTGLVKSLPEGYFIRYTFLTKCLSLVGQNPTCHSQLTEDFDLPVSCLRSGYWWRAPPLPVSISYASLSIWHHLFRSAASYYFIFSIPG